MLKRKEANRRNIDAEEEQPQQELRLRQHPTQKQPNDEQQPPKKMTKSIRGQQNKEYCYLSTVKSVKELNELAFKHYCKSTASLLGKGRTFQSLSLPCRRRTATMKCHYELHAQKQPNSECGRIHVYAHSEHNHDFISENTRLRCKNAVELMPFDNPPKVHRTEDNIEWEFLETVPDFDRMHKIRDQNKCQPETWDKEGKARRISFVCGKHRHGCQFRLLSMKTTKGGYHVYKHGEHTNHPVVKQKKGQKLTDSEMPLNKTKRNNRAALRPTVIKPVVGQKEKYEDWSMEDEDEEDSEDDSDESDDEWKMDEEEVEEDEYFVGGPEKQGTSAASMETAKKKWPVEKPSLVLKPTEPAAEEGQGQIIKNENMDDEDDGIQIIEVVKQRKIGNAKKTAENGVGLRSHPAKLKIDDNGDLSYTVDVSGYQPGEINVEMKGNKIVVRGEYKEQNGDHELQCQFMRSVSVPADINKATIKCDMDNDGHLCITAQSESAEALKIPINVKQTVLERQIKVEVEIHH